MIFTLGKPLSSRFIQKILKKILEAFRENLVQYIIDFACQILENRSEKLVLMQQIPKNGFETSQKNLFFCNQKHLIFTNHKLETGLEIVLPNKFSKIYSEGLVFLFLRFVSLVPLSVTVDNTDIRQFMFTYVHVAFHLHVQV